MCIRDRTNVHYFGRMEGVFRKNFTEDRVKFITTQGNWDELDAAEKVKGITSDEVLVAVKTQENGKAFVLEGYQEN